VLPAGTIGSERLGSAPASATQIFWVNQVVEIFSVNQPAERVKAVGDKLGFRVDLAHVNNPRIEKEEHYYNPSFTRLLELGLKPHYLTGEVLEAMLKRVDQYNDNVNKDIISIGVEWKKSPLFNLHIVLA
jgi:UDP-sulfoquinovose synthase